MKLLIIGGTGTISRAVVRRAVTEGHHVTVMNRGNRNGQLPEGVATITCDINDEAAADAALGDHRYDAVVNFVVFTPDQAERDIRLFRDRCRQYLFISSASAYRKPALDWVIRESTPLGNPYWDYSRQKEVCEKVYLEAWAQGDFPVTIVRPSHTYSAAHMPTALHGATGSYSVLKRILHREPVIVPGDGQSLWTVTWNEDFARGFNGLFGHPAAIGEAFHITSDEALTWDMIYRTIGEALGVEPIIKHVTTDELVAADPSLEGNLRGDKSVSVRFDNRKIKRFVPTFRCEVPFREGARRVVAYLEEHPELHQEDPDFDAFCERFL